MNCQDVSRIIDNGSYAALTPSERLAADSHARGCRHCAPLWYAHSHVAATRIPSMPPELAVRCLTLAAARTRSSTERPASRRIMFVACSLVVLAAAAAVVLSVKTANAPTSLRQVYAEAVPPAPVQAPLQPGSTAVFAGVAGLKPVVPSFADAPPRQPPDATGLPLLPAPIGADNERKSRMNLALRRTVELYPEVVQGPETEGYFVVALALRNDGTVLSRSIQMATALELQEFRAAHTRSLLGLAGSMATTEMLKGALLPDGRALRGHLSVLYAVVSNDFNLAQSEQRVKEIVLANREHLLRPISQEGVNVLTVLLTEDGAIKQEAVGRLSVDDLLKQVNKPDGALDYAQHIADKLGVSPDQLGLVGYTYLTTDSQPGSGQSPRSVGIQYAWPRLATQAEPVFIQADNRVPGIDTVAALVIVERLIPEAFTQTDRSEGKPTVVLTAEGEFIRVEYVQSRHMHLQMQNLAPGRVSISSTTTWLVNKAGARAEVQFVWQYTAAQMEDIAKARSTAPQR